jgi:arabinose-5-phosphate isomerase
MSLALGDALAMTAMRQKGFTRADFGRLHPGGALGARLKPVKRLMHKGDQVPLIRQDASMHDAVVVMTEKRLGVVGVTDDDGHLVGVITDGDLRRNIERGLDHNAAEFMTADPKTVAPDSLVADALTLFEEHRITSLFVVDEDGQDGLRPLGVLHIHDCPAAR